MHERRRAGRPLGDEACATNRISFCWCATEISDAELDGNSSARAYFEGHQIDGSSSAEETRLVLGTRSEPPCCSSLGRKLTLSPGGERLALHSDARHHPLRLNR